MTRKTLLKETDYFDTYFKRFILENTDNTLGIGDIRDIYMNNLDIREERIINACKIECYKQHAMHKADFLVFTYTFVMTDSYKFTRGYGNEEAIHVRPEQLLDMGNLVKNSKEKSFRTTPVLFDNMQHGVAPLLLVNAINQLCSNQHSLTTDEFVKEFLDIHPFTDGNGRVAFILHNLKNKTMDYPNPLPDYYGNN